MAKQTKAQAFTKARIYFDGEDIMVEEIEKDDCRIYNLTEILRGWENIENLSISIKQDSAIAPVVGG